MRILFKHKHVFYESSFFEKLEGGFLSVFLLLNYFSCRSVSKSNSLSKMSLPSNGKSLVKTITVYGFGPVDIVPSSNNNQNQQKHIEASSFVMKLLAFCCYNRIPFSFDGSATFSPTSGRCPWIQVKMDDPLNPIVNIEDSQICIEQLSSCFGINMDSHLTKEEKIQSDNLRYLAEGVLYYNFVRNAWVTHPNYYPTRGALPVPDFLKGFIFGMVRGDIIKTLNMQGNGDLSTWSSEEQFANIYREIARVLGKKKFLFSNDKPSIIDCVLVRFFDKVTVPGNQSITPKPVLDVFEKEYPELKAYGDRLQETFFPAQVSKRLLDEGTRTYLDAKAKATKMISIAVSVIVAVAAVGGYFGWRYLQSSGYL